jgi:predicted transcriptional regulator
MENKENTIEKIDKVTETLIKELESLTEEGLHEFFMFVYKMSHQHGNMIAVDKFEEFLKAFDHNPFKVNEDKKYRKQLIDNVVEYAYYHMGLLTAAILNKKKFTMNEIIQNYYANVDVFSGSWY